MRKIGDPARVDFGLPQRNAPEWGNRAKRTTHARGVTIAAKNSKKRFVSAKKAAGKPKLPKIGEAELQKLALKVGKQSAKLAKLEAKAAALSPIAVDPGAAANSKSAAPTADTASQAKPAAARKVVTARAPQTPAKRTSAPSSN